MPGKAPRQKGNRFEREIVAELKAAGLDAHRIPLSGSQSGFKGDVEIRLQDRKLRGEAKCRAGGFTFIYREIEGNDFLALKVDRKEPLVVMRLADVAAILGAKEARRAAQPANLPSKVQQDLTHPTASIVPRPIRMIVGSEDIGGLS